MENDECQFLRLPFEIRSHILALATISPTKYFCLRRSITHPLYPRRKRAFGKSLQTVFHRESDVLRTFGIPDPFMFYESPINGKTELETPLPSALQLRLVNRLFEREISALILGGISHGAELWIPVTTTLLDLCDRGEETDDFDGSCAEIRHEVSHVHESEVLRWICRWKRVAFLLPVWRIQDLAVLSKIFTRGPKHRVKLVITGFDTGYWEEKDSEAFLVGRQSLGLCKLPISIVSSQLLQDVQLSNEMDMKLAHFRRTSYYKLGFSAIYTGNNDNVNVEGFYISETRTSVLEREYGWEPQLVEDSNAIFLEDDENDGDDEDE